MATAKKPAGAATTRSNSTKTNASANKAPAKSGRAAPSKAAATAKAPTSKSAAKSAAKTPAKSAAKTATKTAAKSAAKTATKTAAKSATKTAAKSSAGTSATGTAATKKAPSKAAAGKRGPNPAFMKPLQPDAQLAEVVGNEPMPRTQVVARVWDYIKKNGLQQSRNINADEKLRPIFGKDQITMFEMMKLVNAHLSDVPA